MRTVLLNRSPATTQPSTPKTWMSRPCTLPLMTCPRHCLRGRGRGMRLQRIGPLGFTTMTPQSGSGKAIHTLGNITCPSWERVGGTMRKRIVGLCSPNGCRMRLPLLPGHRGEASCTTIYLHGVEDAVLWQLTVSTVTGDANQLADRAWNAIPPRISGRRCCSTCRRRSVCATWPCAAR